MSGPTPIKHYQVSSRMSQAVSTSGFVFVAGQIAADTRADVAGQTRDVLAKIDALLVEAGTTRAKLVSINVFLLHMGDFDSMNEVYDTWVDSAHPPARACIEARLAYPDLRVEMAAVAVM